MIGDLYNKLYKAYEKAHPTTSKKENQIRINKVWNEMKDKDNVSSLVEEFVEQCHAQAMKRKGTMFSFWSSQAKAPSVCETTIPPGSSEAAVPPIQDESKTSDLVPLHETNVSNVLTKVSAPAKKCHVQEQLMDQIHVLESELVGLYARKSQNFLSLEQHNLMISKEKELVTLKRQLKERKLDSARQQRARIKKNQKLAALIEKAGEAAAIVGIRDHPGRPEFEASQPGLLEAIIKLAMHGSAAADKRESELIRTVKTLDQLTTSLNSMGFDVKRSGVYLRLQPKRSHSQHGKRHVRATPVRLIRAENSAHKKHEDGKFCTATINMAEELVSMLGPEQCFFGSFDDKCRVALGLPAANEQAPILMHL